MNSTGYAGYGILSVVVPPKINYFLTRMCKVRVRAQLKNGKKEIAEYELKQRTPV